MKNAPHVIKSFLLIICLVIALGTSWMLLAPNHSQNAANETSDNVKPAPQNSDAPIDEFLKTASVIRGHAIAHTCHECHTFDEDGPARLGPNLFGIFEAKHAHMKGYAYSPALMEMQDKKWTTENLNAWLLGPRKYAPGTKMGYPGVANAQDRADLIAYLKTLK